MFPAKTYFLALCDIFFFKRVPHDNSTEPQWHFKYTETELACFHLKLHFTTLLLVYTGSPTVTSLTYDGQSRTLTCTSTGGPATVTWRRDGVVITLNATYQQTKSLVDSVNGTYQTVLTIDPSLHYSRVVGTYNCTVENDRGASSETVIVPGESWTLTRWHTYIPTV